MPRLVIINKELFNIIEHNFYYLKFSTIFTFKKIFMIQFNTSKHVEVFNIHHHPE